MASIEFGDTGKKSKEIEYGLDCSVKKFHRILIRVQFLNDT